MQSYAKQELWYSIYLRHSEWQLLTVVRSMLVTMMPVTQVREYSIL